jgi:transcriptional regulator with XRE-family HTH domain
MIGTKIRTFREAANLKIEYIADVVGIDKSTLSRIENNQVRPKREYVEKIAKELDIDIEDFYEVDPTHIQMVNNSQTTSDFGQIGQFNGVPLEFVEKLLDRVERMNERMVNVIKEALIKRD